MSDAPFDDERPTAQVVYFDEQRLAKRHEAHPSELDTPGFYWVVEDYPEEGWVGPFDSRNDAHESALSCDCRVWTPDDPSDEPDQLDLFDQDRD